MTTEKKITLTPRVKAALSAGSADALAGVLATWPPEELRLLHKELRASYAVARQELDDGYAKTCRELTPLLNNAGQAMVDEDYRDTCTDLAEMFTEIEGVVKSYLKGEEQPS